MDMRNHDGLDGQKSRRNGVTANSLVPQSLNNRPPWRHAAARES
jgi:hypothetical protein